MHCTYRTGDTYRRCHNMNICMLYAYRYVRLVFSGQSRIIYTEKHV